MHDILIAMSIRSRITYGQAAWRLKPIRVGRWPECRGLPFITATNAVAGDAFRLHSTEARTVIGGDGELRIGSDVYLNSGTRIMCRNGITIEDHVLVAFEAVITDTNYHGIAGEPEHTAPVRIGSGSWIGARAIVLPGVTVGARSIVGAGSVVTKDVPPSSIVAGNPARVVRELHLPANAITAFTRG